MNRSEYGGRTVLPHWQMIAPWRATEIWCMGTNRRRHALMQVAQGLSRQAFQSAWFSQPVGKSGARAYNRAHLTVDRATRVFAEPD